MGFSARNIETKLIVAACDEDAVLGKILEIANAAQADQLTDLPKGETRTWQVCNEYGEVWPSAGCAWGTDDDCRRILELCEPGSAIEYLNEDDFLFNRFERTAEGVKAMSSRPFAYWDIPEPLSISVEAGDGFRINASALPNSRAIAIDVQRPDGLTGQIAYVERTPEAMRGEYRTEFHAFAYNGQDTDPSCCVDFDTDGDEVAYLPR